MATDKKRIMISLTDDQYADLEAISEETGLTKSACVSLAMAEWSKKMRRRAIRAAEAKAGAAEAAEKGERNEA